MARNLFLIVTLLLIFNDGLSTLQRTRNITGLDYNAWWGSDTQIEKNSSIRPYKIEFSDEMINDLILRLKYRRPITPSYQRTWFDYGIPSRMVEDWLHYWEKEYPFKQREQIINRFPHYKTNIQGLDIHFVWIRPRAPKNVEVVPLLMLNGWPSSFVEFYNVIPRLTAYDEQRDFVIEVIVPTLPGFTLSEGAAKPGLSAPDIAVIFRNLMRRLGYKKYYIQGGDFGSIVGNSIATLFPQEVLGFHANMIMLLSVPPRIQTMIAAVFPEMSNSMYMGNNTRGRTFDDYIHQSAYMYHQATVPDTLGLGINDSPSGLLGYLLEKFHFGRVLDRKENAGSMIESYIPRDDLLDNIMLYWLTGSITTSMRIYAETLSKRVFAMNIDEIPTPVPTWIIEAKYEGSMYPTWVFKTKYPNLISYKTLDTGGHFLAFELPEFFADDVIEAITAFRNWHQVKYLKAEL